MGEPELIKAMQVLSLEPGDTLVLMVGQPISSEMADRIKQHVHAILGDVPMLILDKGIGIGVLRKAA